LLRGPAPEDRGKRPAALARAGRARAKLG
jgi:hypothetical protein